MVPRLFPLLLALLVGAEIRAQWPPCPVSFRTLVDQQRQSLQRLPAEVEITWDGNTFKADRVLGQSLSVLLLGPDQVDVAKIYSVKQSGYAHFEYWATKFFAEKGFLVVETDLPVKLKGQTDATLAQLKQLLPFDDGGTDFVLVRKRYVGSPTRS